MRLTIQSIEYLDGVGGRELIEKCARTCYKSEDKISPGSAQRMVNLLKEKGHEAMLEFGWMAYKCITDRGVSHEIVRHRLFSFAQESTRYCDYKNKEMEFIIPPWYRVEYFTSLEWRSFLIRSEQIYQFLREEGWKPQQARSVLPNALKTEICIGGNFREWRHFFKLRISNKAHPQIRELANMILEDCKDRFEGIFDDIGE